eukprot:scaffold1541_cov418-Prasinococcus_capsulatus_cf.AAC.23
MPACPLGERWPRPYCQTKLGWWRLGPAPAPVSSPRPAAATRSPRRCPRGLQHRSWPGVGAPAGEPQYPPSAAPSWTPAPPAAWPDCHHPSACSPRARRPARDFVPSAHGRQRHQPPPGCQKVPARVVDHERPGGQALTRTPSRGRTPATGRGERHGGDLGSYLGDHLGD